jgi:L-threonylcarbamoyladenylate synthase
MSLREVTLPEAVSVLKQGRLLIYPTETVYGLGADVFHTEALDRLFQLKGREAEKAVSVLVASREEIFSLAGELEPLAVRLIDRYLPGPLTLVLPAAASIPPRLTGGAPWIGIRMSSHPLAQALAAGFGRAITTTSANPSGSPAAARIAELRDYFAAQPDVSLLSGGDLPPSRGSTVVQVENGRLKLLREGEIPFTEIEKFIQEI